MVILAGLFYNLYYNNTYFFFFFEIMGTYSIDLSSLSPILPLPQMNFFLWSFSSFIFAFLSLYLCFICGKYLSFSYFYLAHRIEYCCCQQMKWQPFSLVYKICFDFTIVELQFSVLILFTINRLFTSFFSGSCCLCYSKLIHICSVISSPW